MEPTRQTIVPTRADARNYADASGDHNPIHTDDAAAEAVGLPGVIMHGMWTAAKLANAATRSAGCDPLGLVRLSVEFRGYALPDQPLDLDVVGDGASRSVTAWQDERRVASGVVELRRRP